MYGFNLSKLIQERIKYKITRHTLSQVNTAKLTQMNFKMTILYEMNKI